MQLRQENQVTYDFGKAEIDKITCERLKFNEDANASISLEIQAEKDRNKELNIEVENMMEKIRYLHRVNNELIYSFCNY